MDLFFLPLNLYSGSLAFSGLKIATSFIPLLSAVKYGAVVWGTPTGVEVTAALGWMELSDG